MYVLHENVVNTEVYSYTFTLSKKSEHYKTKVILSLLQKSCFFKVVLSFDSMYFGHAQYPLMDFIWRKELYSKKDLKDKTSFGA